ncbi:hypothetical protein FOFC_13372 [Fusarium oxysporum]|nr:hypothetical protein FOFC_13372 [Fusarium oxysporum]
MSNRGEAANHSMFDAYMLGCQLRKVNASEKSMAQAIQDFEKEMIARAQEGIARMEAALSQDISVPS